MKEGMRFRRWSQCSVSPNQIRRYNGDHKYFSVVVACSILDQFLYPNILIVYSNFGGRIVKRLNIISFMLCVFISNQSNLAHSADVTFDISYYYYEEPNFMNDYDVRERMYGNKMTYK